MHYYNFNKSFKPEKDIEYFFHKDNNNDNENILLLISVYNENLKSLVLTLRSINKNLKYLKTLNINYNIKILIIIDGYDFISPDVFDFLKKTYNKDNWWDNDVFTTKIVTNIENDKKNEYNTLILEDDDLIKVEDDLFLDITTILKIDNRKKFNSHEWFFGNNGFIDKYTSKYSLLVDVYTLLSKYTLYYSLLYMNENENCVASTGRLITMSKSKQNIKESICSYSKHLRDVQYCNFEYGNLTMAGPLSYSGLLHVIPGPFGIYRTSDLRKDKVRNYYFNYFNDSSDDLTLTYGNLKNVEDRILTISIVLNNNNPEAYTFFNPNVKFYIDPEASMKSLLLQRRRWTNGTLYYFLYFLRHSEIFIYWNTNIYRKMFTLLLFLGTFLFTIIGYFSVIINSYLLKIILIYLDQQIFYTNSSYIHNNEIYLFICFLFYLNTFLHLNKKYIKSYLIFLNIVGILLSIFIHGAVFVALYINYKKLLLPTYNNAIIFVYILTYLFPFITLFLSGQIKAFFKLIKCSISYYLHINMFSMLINTYSLGRLWDLSWGNKPSIDIEKRTNNITLLQFKNLLIYAVFIFVNILIYLSDLYITNFMLGFLSICIFYICLLQFITSLFYISNILKYRFRKFKTREHLIIENIEDSNSINSEDKVKVQENNNNKSNKKKYLFLFSLISVIGVSAIGVLFYLKIIPFPF